MPMACSGPARVGSLGCPARHGEADDDAAATDADHQADLLGARRGADDVAGLQVLATWRRRWRRRCRPCRPRTAPSAGRRRPSSRGRRRSGRCAISVAMVMPEIGFDDEPMTPDDAAGHGDEEEPEHDDQQAQQQLAAEPECRARRAARAMTTTRRQAADEHDGDGQVALGALAARRCPPRCRSDATLSLNEETMVGRVLSRVMKPPAATAPAPIWRT